MIYNFVVHSNEMAYRKGGFIGLDPVAFIQCVDGREPQIHEVWSLGLDGIIIEVHPKAQV